MKVQRAQCPRATMTKRKREDEEEHGEVEEGVEERARQAGRRRWMQMFRSQVGGDVEGKGSKGSKGPKGELRSICRAGRRGQVFRSQVGDDAEAKGSKGRSRS